MGNCIEFKKGRLRASVACTAADAEDVMDEISECSGILEQIDDAVREFLENRPSGIMPDGLEFSMEPDSAEMVLEAPLEYLDSFGVTYTARGEDGRFLLTAEISRDGYGGPDDVQARFRLIREEADGSFEHYRFDSGSWEPLQGLTEYCRLLDSCSPGAEIARSAAEGMGLSPYSLDPGMVLGWVRKNSGILSLCEALDGLAYPALELPEKDEFSLEDVNVVLLPDDCLRTGCVVTRDNRGFRMYMSFYGAQACGGGWDGWDGWSTFEMPEDAEGEVKSFRRCVFTTKDAARMERALVFMLDHYNGKGPLLSFPLSECARAESYDPGEGFKVVRNRENRELSGAEKGNLGFLRDFFGCGGQAPRRSPQEKGPGSP